MRAYRQRLGMSQEELATRTGVSVRSIRNLEAGRTGRPRSGTLRLLADAFGLAGAERDRFCRCAIEDIDRPRAGDVVDAGTVRGRPVPAQLPADVAGFVGRSHQLGRLSKLLDDGHRQGSVVILAIAGTAGVGKTTLAVRWAHRVLDRFPDGQLYVNLRGFDPGGAAATPAEVLRSFLDALDVPAQRMPEGVEAQAALYRSLLAERRMLVLLDNARDVDQVRPLLPGTQGCLVLVTSRNQLTGLIAGAGAIPLPLDRLDLDEARDLLARRLGVDCIAAEPDAVEEIIERCARLPLALVVVAARVTTQPELSLAALAAELAHPRERLDSLVTGDAGTDVRSVFSWSYRQLPRPAARLFRLLGVHPGPELSVSAAASLAGTPPARVRPMLAELVRAQMVSEPVPGRYALHDLLRAYAGELVASGGPHEDWQAALRRLLDHYLGSAHPAAAALHPAREVIELIEPLAGVTIDEFGSAGSATDWFTSEYQVLTAAVRLAVDAGLDRHAWQLVWSMTPFFERHQDVRDALALHQIALQAARRVSDLAAQGYSHRRLGQVSMQLAFSHSREKAVDQAIDEVKVGTAMPEEHDQARSHLEHALEVYRQLGDDTNQAHARLALAAILDREGRHRDALHQAGQALAQFRAVGHRVGQANALNNAGWYHARLGEYETALQYCQQALGLHQELGNRRGEAFTWDSLGVAYHHLGRRTDAIACYQRALTLFRDNGYRYFEAGTLVNLGDTYCVAGDISAARDCWRTALAILTDLHHPDADQVLGRLHNAR